ncbi:MAG: 30S ribosomal protein S27ae [Candidatus Micrarchaeota archaeon]
MAEKKGSKEKSFRPYVSGKSCPKCGSGTRLGKHTNRLSCGKCGYMEMV